MSAPAWLHAETLRWLEAEARKALAANPMNLLQMLTYPAIADGLGSLAAEAEARPAGWSAWVVACDDVLGKPTFAYGCLWWPRDAVRVNLDENGETGAHIAEVWQRGDYVCSCPTPAALRDVLNTIAGQAKP